MKIKFVEKPLILIVPTAIVCFFVPYAFGSVITMGFVDLCEEKSNKAECLAKIEPSKQFFKFFPIASMIGGLIILHYDFQPKQTNQQNKDQPKEGAPFE